MFTGKTDVEAETAIFSPPAEKTDSLEKTDAGRDWGKKEKEMPEDEMAGWHH